MKKQHSRPALLVTFVTAVAILLGMATPAQAVTPMQVVNAVKDAYEAYQKLNNNQFTLQQATDQIISRIEQVEDHIIDHIDLIAAADIEACSLSAVDLVSSLPSMTPTAKQIFAFNTTDCVNKAKTFVNAASSKAAIDHVGYALHAVGPIALIARKHAGLSEGTLRTNIIGASNTVISKLNPSCQATPLWGDSLPGGWVEVRLSCTAFNGNVGATHVLAQQPFPVWNYSVPRAAAMVGTSWQLSMAAAPVI